MHIVCISYDMQNGGQLTSTQPKSTESNKHAIEREGELILVLQPKMEAKPNPAQPMKM